MEDVGGIAAILQCALNVIGIEGEDMSEYSERHAVRLALKRYAAHGAHAVVVDLDEVVHNHAHDFLRYDVANDSPCVALVVGRLLDEAVHLLRYGLAVGLLGWTGCHQANGHCGKNEDESNAPVSQRVALVLLTFLIAVAMVHGFVILCVGVELVGVIAALCCLLSVRAA